MSLAGGPADLVREALDSGAALPGTRGFAGEVDGLLVRDVLGRRPLFYEAEDPATWSQDRTALAEPTRLPAGWILEEGNRRQRWSLPRPEPSDAPESDQVESLREAIDESLTDVRDGDPDHVANSGLAVGFSGGLDSAILAEGLDAPLYTVGFPDSHDVSAARMAADLLGEEVRVIELDHDAIREAIPAVVAATGRTDAMAVQIALPIYLLAEAVRADGFDRLALGQGADELFGGYAKVARAPEDPRVEAETVRGARRELVETLPAQLERDALAVRAGGVDPVLPLLHDRVVKSALSLPGDLLVTDRGERKWALRLAARRWLPDQIAFREKKALQYGSLVARELDRLARQAGFKRRQDDHVRAYIESRC